MLPPRDAEDHDHEPGEPGDRYVRRRDNTRVKRAVFVRTKLQLGHIVNVLVGGGSIHAHFSHGQINLCHIWHYLLLQQLV